VTEAWDEKQVFLKALNLSGSRRRAYLDEACPDDSTRDRIETLLQHHAAATNDFLKGVEETPVEPAKAPDFIDEFKIIRRLGEGGMGVVYLAEDTILGRRVALKLLAPHLTGSEQALARFREEARSTALLKHRAIVPVYKPSNILMDPDQGPRLTDFGIAKHLVEEDRSDYTALVGSCHYMSPEQADIAGADVDQRSDIFSLGVVLYEMLSFRRPFDGKSMHHVLKAVAECHPARLRSLDRHIPVDLETICHKAMEKQPSDRYQTAAHVAADLRCFLVGDPILACPPSLVRRTRQALRRYRSHAPAMALIVVVFSFLVIWWQSDRHRRSRACLVRVTCEAPRARLTIVPIDQSTHEPGRPMGHGNIPQQLALPVGQYRIIAVQSPEMFSESTLFVSTGGTELSLHLPPPRSASDLTGMMLFEGGDYTCGKPGQGGLQGEHTVSLRPFLLDVAEVSNADYKRFVDATDYPVPAHWQAFGYDPDLAEHPVVGISWEDANAYCRFVGKRLPTAAEWECAMREPDGRLLPWGEVTPEGLPQVMVESIERMSSADPRMTYEEYARCTRPVRSDESLCTPAGLFHGATNASEYTSTILPGVTAQVVVKGAAYVNLPSYFDTSAIQTMPLRVPGDEGTMRPTWSMKIGFRCARSAQLPQETQGAG